MDGIGLDAGCGDNPYADELDECIGLDIEQHDDIDVCGNVLSLPFKDDSFDYVISTQVIEYTPDPFQMFSELKRVLKPNGRLLLTTNMMFDIHSAPHDYFRFTRYGLRELANRSGLEITEEFNAVTFPIRASIKLNYVFDALFPKNIALVFILINNIIFHPLRGIDFKEDYTLVGIIATNVK